MSETLSEHPPNDRACGELPASLLHVSGLAHSGTTSLTHTQSGEGSSRLDDVSDGLNASAEAATHSQDANTLSRDVTQSAERVTQSAERVTQSAERLMQSGGGVTNDSGIASSSRQSQEREASKELADAMLLASVAASPMPAKANQQSFTPSTGQSCLLIGYRFCRLACRQ